MSGAKKGVVLALAAAVLVAGCETGIPKEALQLSHESLQLRELQTRRFDTGDEKMLLAAAAALLQDLGFQLDESETELGLIVGSKERDAKEAGQIAAVVLFTVLLAAMADGEGPPPVIPYDSKQKMRASIVTRPMGAGGHMTAVRVTFQRIVWDNHGQVSKIEGLTDPKAYQEFFAKLSKAVFLEAHKI